MSSPTTDPAIGGFPEMSQHEGEPHGDSVNNKLNALRAAVLGADDGIISVAGIVMVFVGATNNGHIILVAGLAGLVSGALSMAAGEYVSVSTQRDTERALIAKETRELAEEPEEELSELADLYFQKGLSPELARQVAIELTEKDALRAHLEIELGIDPDDLTSPGQAAMASAISFVIGALLPLLAATLVPDDVRAIAILVAVTLALACTGVISARVGGSRTGPAVLRIVFWGLVSMGIGYGVGSLVGIGLA
jgi:VIT1/CCC1 family predicted Fe2+/Mn2+ transporter